MVVVPLVSSQICRRHDVYGNAITDGMVCAGSFQNEADACDGDSGGPLTCTERDGKYILFLTFIPFISFIISNISSKSVYDTDGILVQTFRSKHF